MPLCDQVDRAVGADADEGLLADRDQAAVAGERVPHHREDHEDQERGHLLRRVRSEQPAGRTRARPRGRRRAAVKMREIGVQRSTRSAREIAGDAHAVLHGARGCRPRRGREHGQEHQVAREDRVLRVDLRADRSGRRRARCRRAACPRASRSRRSPPPRTRRSAASARSSARRSSGSRERGRRARRRDGDGGRTRVDRARVDADELRRVGVLRGGAHDPARGGARQEQLECRRGRRPPPRGSARRAPRSRSGR